MKKTLFLILALIFLSATAVMAAYHHEGEKDADKFLTAYPDAAATKLDHCALCHSGGQYENSKGKMVSLGSCQWCHYSYGYDAAGEIEDTINVYGVDYKDAGRNATAVTSINTLDSDGDGYTNGEEIDAGTFPGNADDHPGLTPAPSKVYTKSQLEAMDQHTQFMLMNASRSNDKYTEYTGVILKDLLDDAGILPSATGITVYAPDGWSQYHPLEYDEDAEMYHVYGNMPNQNYQYPPATYSYDEEADLAKNPEDGWCEYDAPGCAGRSNGDNIVVDGGGLKALLAISRDGGTPLETGVLTDENKLDGEGPYRVVVPQKRVPPNAPDQRSSADNQDVVWPYTYDWDHNAGACSRSATIIRVEPLPEGTTDVDILEAGWAYVDDGKVLIYGAIAESIIQDWYQDTDKDGYSDGTTLQSVNRPAENFYLSTELTDISHDCNDNDAAINPGANEICNDGKDNNCDGTIDEECPQNSSPVANAGIDKTVNSGDMVTLDGSGSTDSDGTITSYMWTQTEGSPTVVLSQNNVAKPTFKAPSVSVSTMLTFQLSVEDDGELTATDSVIITVKEESDDDDSCFITTPFK